jgi:hypothetical protein
MGCAAKKPTLPSGPAFQLQSSSSGSVLFAPSIAKSQTNNAAIKLDLERSIVGPSVPARCSAQEGPFRLEQASGDPAETQVTLPSPDNWFDILRGGPQPDGSDGMEAFYLFLADLDRAQQSGCFAETSAPPRDYILQSLPMKPSDSLFNAYGYRLERSGLDLKPGLRLKVERAYFRPAGPGGEEHAVKNYLGVSTVNFDVELGGDGKIRFQEFGEIQYSPNSLAQTGEEGRQDVALRGLVQQTHCRLLFYTYLVPNERRTFATVIGAGSASLLDELERELRANPEKDCKSVAAAKGVECIEFNGFVTVSAQINVELNGQLRFVDWGTSVQQVLPKNSLKSLRIQRVFKNSYYDVRFDALDPHILLLALVGGDRLTWSKGAALAP